MRSRRSCASSDNACRRERSARPLDRASGDQHPQRQNLLADAELADDVDIPLRIHAAQIVQQRAAAADHGQEAAPAGIILLVRPHVLGQVVNPRP